MNALSFKAASIASRPEKQSPPLQRSQSVSQFSVNQYIEALQGKIDSLIDGVVILTEQQELIYANTNALRILRRLDPSNTCENSMPQEVLYICQSLLDSRSLFPHQHWLMESEIFANDSTALHIRARWLQVDPLERPCLLLTIEDSYQALRNIAIEEAQKYGLTPREKEVWLLHRSNYSYKQISCELCITPNTVKKHMRSIHVKKKDNDLLP